TPEPTPIPTPEPTPEPTPIPTPEPPPIPQTAGPSDIAGHWAESAILYAFNRGLTGNLQSNQPVFPDQQITRGEFAAYLERWITANYATLANLGFSYDGQALPIIGVAEDHPLLPSLHSLAQMGMIGGNVPFMPDEPVQRQEASRILLNLLLRLPNSSFDVQYFSNLNVEQTLSRFSDQASIAGWARDSIAVLVDRGFLFGPPNIRPTAIMTRAEIFITFQYMETGLR
ncbi:MAG: S-layer homology domain-containing protein, partial [Firmicutes bacterium]|nr:S-layer homology domain-containing protein [Bacillota bacterium]